MKNNKNNKNKEYGFFEIDNDNFPIFVIIISFVSVMTILLLSFTFNFKKLANDAWTEKQETITTAEQLIQNENYLVFLDGKEIDFSNIDISKYSIKIDDTEKKIILTSNTMTTTDIEPFFVPFLFY